jgi:hypothetical protein
MARLGTLITSEHEAMMKPLFTDAVRDTILGVQ